MYNQQQLFEENMKNILSLFFTWAVADICACVDIWLIGIAVTQFSQKFKMCKCSIQKSEFTLWQEYFLILVRAAEYYQSPHPKHMGQ